MPLKCLILIILNSTKILLCTIFTDSVSKKVSWIIHKRHYNHNNTKKNFKGRFLGRRGDVDEAAAMTVLENICKAAATLAGLREKASRDMMKEPPAISKKEKAQPGEK